MIELDDIDKRIVAALQAEGRLPIVDLADRVGLSATPCQRRVKRLEEEGVITRYAALVSPAAMGVGLQALVEITLEDHSEKTVDAFEAAIRARTEVVAAHAGRERHALVFHHASREERSCLGAGGAEGQGAAMIVEHHSE